MFSTTLRENMPEIRAFCDQYFSLYFSVFFDVTFNLSNATYRPFCKSNNGITYIHKESNHPPSILRQIPLSIESRLSKHSSNEKIFKESTQIYQEALKKSGYDHQQKEK